MWPSRTGFWRVLELYGSIRIRDGLQHAVEQAFVNKAWGTDFDDELLKSQRIHNRLYDTEYL